MLGDRDEVVRKLLESVFNAVLQAEASEQVGADLYERTDERLTYRNRLSGAPVQDQSRHIRSAYSQAS